MEIVVSILSCFIASWALFFSYKSFRLSHRTSIRPVLIFSNADHADHEETTWYVENVGNGPALNVILCGGRSLTDLDSAGSLIIPGFAKGARERLSFIELKGVLVAKYCDVHGHKYTSTCFDNFNRLEEGDSYPDLAPTRALYQIRARVSKAPARG